MMKIPDRSRLEVHGDEYSYERRNDLPLLVNDAGTAYVLRDAAGRTSLPTDDEIAALVASGHARLLSEIRGRAVRRSDGIGTPIRRLSLPRPAPSASSGPVEGGAQRDPRTGGRGDAAYWTEQAERTLNYAVTRTLVDSCYTIASAYELYRREVREINLRAGGEVIAVAKLGRFRRRAKVVEFLLEQTAPERLHRRTRRSGTIH